MTKEPTPVSLILTEEQASLLLEASEEGGHQQLHETLRSQLANGFLTISLNDDDLGKVVRFVTQYGTGNFHSRLRQALQDPLVRLLGGDRGFRRILQAPDDRLGA